MNQLYEAGLEIRREVLGSEAVDRSLAAVNDFTQPMNELTTEWCWGKVWGRPGLEHQTRSIVNLALLKAPNRPNELKLHVRGDKQRSKSATDSGGSPTSCDLLRHPRSDRKLHRGLERPQGNEPHLAHAIHAGDTTASRQEPHAQMRDP